MKKLTVSMPYPEMGMKILKLKATVEILYAAIKSYSQILRKVHIWHTNISSLYLFCFVCL